MKIQFYSQYAPLEIHFEELQCARHKRMTLQVFQGDLIAANTAIKEIFEAHGKLYKYVRLTHTTTHGDNCVRTNSHYYN